MKILRSLLSLLLLSVFIMSVFTEEIETERSFGTEIAYYFDDHSGYDHGQTGGFIAPNYNVVDSPGGFSPAAGDDARTLGSGWGSAELQLYLSHKMTIPFLQGNTNLTEGNNTKIRIDLYAAPVALYTKASVKVTPLAFFNLELGSMIGTGWNAFGFNGLGLNRTGTAETSSFPGIVTQLWTSASFQFDLAAIMPGEWNHIVLVANGKVQYNYFSAAGNEEPWQWLADSGENFNGFQFKGTYFIGYQMPLLLDTIGFLLETEENIGANRYLSTMSDNGWGSDFVTLTFGPMGNFKLGKQSDLTVLVQFQSGRDYTDDTIFNTYFINRVYEDTYVKLYRIAMSYKYTF